MPRLPPDGLELGGLGPGALLRRVWRWLRFPRTENGRPLSDFEEGKFGHVRARWALDGVVAVALLCLAFATWLADRGPPSAGLPPGTPSWARLRDLLLEGPDAGAWASNANALVLGRLDDLDPHRLPVYPRLIAWATHFYPDVPTAGHVVNHACYLLVGPVVYLLGRRWMSAGAAAGAAAATLIYPAGLQADQRFGVDPLVTLAVPLALLAAEVGAWRWWVAPLGGLVCGALATSHLTTVGVPVAALLLCLLRGRPGITRWGGALAFAGGAYAGARWMFVDYPVLPLEILRGTLAEGVAAQGGNAATAGFATSTGGAVAAVQAGLPRALDEVVRFAATKARPSWLPWAVMLAVPWLGVLGGELTRGGVFAWRRVGAGAAVGLPLLIALAPLLAFAAAGSPERYTDNFYPLVALLIFRGLDAIAGIVDALLRRPLPGWPLGLVAAGLALAAVRGIHHPSKAHPSPPTLTDAGAWQVGAALRAEFGPGGGASCPDREIDAYAGRIYCPHSAIFLYAKEPEPVPALLSAECSGEGPIPFVILEKDGDREPLSADRKAMNAWVAEHGEFRREVTAPGLRAKIYAVKRVSLQTTTPH